MFMMQLGIYKSMGDKPVPLVQVTSKDSVPLAQRPAMQHCIYKFMGDKPVP